MCHRPPTMRAHAARRAVVAQAAPVRQGARNRSLHSSSAPRPLTALLPTSPLSSRLTAPSPQPLTSQQVLPSSARRASSARCSADRQAAARRLAGAAAACAQRRVGDDVQRVAIRQGGRHIRTAGARIRPCRHCARLLHTRRLAHRATIRRHTDFPCSRRRHAALDCTRARSSGRTGDPQLGPSLCHATSQA